MPITHSKVSAKSDGGDATLVLPSDWNDTHDVDYLELPEASAPGTPGSGLARLYVKTDGRVYSKDDAGTEYGPFDAAGGGGPLLYQDSLALHADGDEMDDDTLAAWTLGGGLTTGDVTAITTEPYDDTCLDVVFAAHKDRMLRTIPGSWTNMMLTLHGITNSTPSPATASGAMIGLCIVDSNGDGCGITNYSDGATYVWTVDDYGYNAGPVTVPGGWTTVHTGAQASNMPIILRLRKSGTNIYGGMSFNGGLSFGESSAKVVTNTFDRFGIIRLFTSGGTDPTLRIGRIQIT